MAHHAKSDFFFRLNTHFTAPWTDCAIQGGCTTAPPLRPPSLQTPNYVAVYRDAALSLRYVKHERKCSTQCHWVLGIAGILVTLVQNIWASLY
jgi:hypothetical protein